MVLRVAWLAVWMMCMPGMVAALSWTHPTGPQDALSPQESSAYGPRVALSDRGQALVAWVQSDGKHPQIFVAERADSQSPWTVPQGLQDNVSPDGTIADYPDVAVDRAGNALVAWRQWDGSNWQVYLSERRKGVWTHPKDLTDVLSLPGSKAEWVRVAMADDGRSVATWQQERSFRHAVYLAEFDGLQWHKPQSLLDSVSPAWGEAAFPIPALAPGGHGVLTWYQIKAGRSLVLASWRDAQGWHHPTWVDEALSLLETPAMWSTPAVNRHGERAVLWTQRDLEDFQRVYLTGTLGGQDYQPENLGASIAPAGSHACFPGSYAPIRVRMDDSGDLVAVWSQGLPPPQMGSRVLLAERRGGNWTLPGSVEEPFSAEQLDAWDPDVAVNPTGGDALAAWVGDGPWGSAQVFVRRYHAGTWDGDVGKPAVAPFGSFVNLPALTKEEVASPAVAMNRRDRGVVAWQQKIAGTWRIFVSTLQ